jgi:hypothetical protein
MTKFKIENLEELGKISDAEINERIRKGRWGAWYLTADRKSFGILRAYAYEIELDQLESDGPLRWLAHLREKTWLRRGDVEDLISAFDDLFGYGWIYAALNNDKRGGPTSGSEVGEEDMMKEIFGRRGCLSGSEAPRFPLVAFAALFMRGRDEKTCKKAISAPAAV